MPAHPIQTSELKVMENNGVTYAIRVGGVRMTSLEPDAQGIRISYAVSGTPSSHAASFQDMQELRKAAAVLGVAGSREFSRAILLYEDTGRLAGFYTDDPSNAVLFIDGTPKT